MRVGGGALTLRGEVKNGVVVFQSGLVLPDGTLVEVTPLPSVAAGPFAGLAGTEAASGVSQESISEAGRPVGAKKPSPTTIDPFADFTPGQVSQETAAKGMVEVML
jgi:hypothetical protein